ncbi:MAG: enoyl-CoA hydratase/isomerase family protein [Proteobacteria bacterium]|nr:enoyl-CoA hydratase/isomerase family protein [Pseudomonadota bacterium]
MGMFEYTLDGHAALVTMNSGENRFNFEFIAAFLDLLDELENQTPATVLVVKSAHEKIWSNGIDLDWLVPAVAGNPKAARTFPLALMKLLRRVLTYPMVTIAAINGHVFAGAVVLACAFDFRFMRSDRGFFCVPEVDIQIPFMPGMEAILRKAIPRYKLIEMQLSGGRYTASECEAHHVVVKACHLDDLMDEVMTFARGYNKDRKVVGIMKQVSYKAILDVMDTEDEPYLEANRP